MHHRLTAVPWPTNHSRAWVKIKPGKSDRRVSPMSHAGLYFGSCQLTLRCAPSEDPSEDQRTELPILNEGRNKGSNCSRSSREVGTLPQKRNGRRAPSWGGTQCYFTLQSKCPRNIAHSARKRSLLELRSDSAGNPTSGRGPKCGHLLDRKRNPKQPAFELPTFCHPGVSKREWWFASLGFLFPATRKGESSRRPIRLDSTGLQDLQFLREARLQVILRLTERKKRRRKTEAPGQPGFWVPFLFFRLSFSSGFMRVSWFEGILAFCLRIS